MRLPRKIAGLLMAAGTAAGITAAAAPAHADPTYVMISTTTPGGNLCLEGDPAPDFAYRVTTQPCNAANNQAQQWDIQDQGGGIVKLANHAISGWCIEANTIANGSPIPLWPCTSTESNLRWAWIHNAFGIQPVSVADLRQHRALPGRPHGANSPRALDAAIRLQRHACPDVHCHRPVSG